ncbi:putative NADH dehydrogenase [ubiquinone] 1 alpha subcomplex subunit 5, mitochondrial [Vitis vinifera]|uniref:Putative NADH dehydrogenase [ubiquinone] 1 alpha subcomplex subunit 5, mitochondrial n=1 Tax=Vitis vinifera TaxID=29760 RepID=A0A438E2S8_VITVI|nr:putative NADH dehydrogenase [ubiquinone] 1 alpha subcomplex subunit 5, mitochondrial [Vitis vinifera]RVX01929.1 putative NADH dehydrogenase [ubiquinone] 1 alpha subcomplex subunit 5, mitochondrial [Vitis vinifera]
MFLRRIARPLMAKVKETTGIVGLDVVPNAREVLISLYTKTLNEIQTVPEDEGYRKAVESFTSHRLKVCQEEEDWEQIEKRLGCGQVEELIEEAQDELKLLSMLNGNEEKGVLTVVLMMRNDSCVRLGFGGSFMFCGK